MQLIRAKWCIYAYRQAFHISRIVVGNTIVDHSNVVGASIAYRRYSNFILILDWTPGVNGFGQKLGKDNSKTRQGTLKLWHLVRFILEVWR